MLLLPEPFGPATIQKIGRSALAPDTVGRAEKALVLPPRLGHVPGEYVLQTLIEAGAVRVQGTHGLPPAVRRCDPLFSDRRRGLHRPAVVETLEDDLGHGSCSAEAVHI